MAFVGTRRESRPSAKEKCRIFPDDFWVKERRHSKTTSAKKRYTPVIQKPPTPKNGKPKKSYRNHIPQETVYPRHSETTSAKQRYTPVIQKPHQPKNGILPSFRNHISQKTVIPVIRKSHKPKNRIPNSFRNHINQKTVYLETSILADLACWEGVSGKGFSDRTQ